MKWHIDWIHLLITRRYSNPRTVFVVKELLPRTRRPSKMRRKFTKESISTSFAINDFAHCIRTTNQPFFTVATRCPAFTLQVSVLHISHGIKITSRAGWRVAPIVCGLCRCLCMCVCVCMTHLWYGVTRTRWIRLKSFVCYDPLVGCKTKSYPNQRRTACGTGPGQRRQETPTVK